MTLAEFLQKFISKFDFLEAIILSDKEGIEVCGGYTPNTDLKENSAAMLFCTALTQTNENLQKIYQTKSRAVTLFYEGHLVYIENWNNINLSIFAKSDANLGLIYEIAGELKQSFGQLTEALDKIK